MSQSNRATQFRKKYRIKTINSAALCSALTAQGYTVIEFNGVNDSEDVRTIIDALGLRQRVQQSKCFVYRDSSYRLLFIHSDLNEQERVVALAHEQGHIYNGHMSKSNVFGDDTLLEYEANEFAHYLLKSKTIKGRHSGIIAALCVLLVIAISVIGVAFAVHRNNSIYTDNLYRTESGAKYHLRDCMYIKDKTDVYRLTKEEYESNEYQPCSACLPDRTE